MASLWPVDGEPLEVLDLLRSWLRTDADPLVVQTSGSTGEPKQVVLPAAALRASAEASLDRLGGPGQWLLCLPVRHVGGLQVLARSVLAGVEPVVVPDLDRFSATVATMPVGRRYAALVPTQLSRLLDTGQAEALARLDAVLLGGAAVGGGLLARARAAGVPVVTSYGLTETCGGCVYDGVPLDGVSVALGDGGRIRIAGPVLFAGYLGRPDLTAQVLSGGWLTTADVGRFDEDRRLEVLGRVDDVVVSGGVNVGTGAVRSRLLEHPGVRDAAVIGVPDPEWGAVVVAFVVAQDPAPSLAQVREFVAERLPRTWAPRRLVGVAELPMLPSGKVDVGALRITAVAASQEDDASAAP